MLSDGNKKVLQDACSRVREANRLLKKGSAYTASRCCRDAEERFVYVMSRSEVTAQEVDEFVKENSANRERKQRNRCPTTKAEDGES